jgi:sugar phosphate isomerase/epimerase
LNKREGGGIVNRAERNREQTDKYDVPRQYRRLSRVLGLSALLRLCREYGGECLYIPQTKTIERERRRTEVMERLSRGEGVEEIAAALGVDKVTIYNDIREIMSRKKHAGNGWGQKPKQSAAEREKAADRTAAGKPAKIMEGQMSLFE